MATPNRKILDLSHHNDIEDIQQVKKAGVLGIIHKSTEGDDYTDPTYADRKKLCLDAGLLWGAYHFAHPGHVEAQVDNFLAVTGNDKAMLYALDWEESSSGTMSEAEAEQFCDLVEQRTGRKCVIYSGNAAKEEIEGINEYLGSHRLWLAQYGSSPVCQESWDDWWIWQYSDGQNGPQPRGCPGVSGDVDTNSWAGTDEELRAEWSGTTIRPPRPRPEVAVVAITIQAPSTVEVRVTVNDEELTS
jgi:lysozyme